jgi:ferredoxin
LTYVVNESCIRCKIMDCVDVCPVWLSLNAEYAKIWPNITVKKAPPPDSKEWEGKPDKILLTKSRRG